MAITPNSIVTPQTVNAPVFNALLSTAMTSTKAYDGTEAAGTAMALLYTVGTNGGKLPALRAKYSGTNGTTPSGTTTATVLRLWVNNGSGANTTAANNSLYDELAVPAQAMSAVATTPTLLYDFGGLTLPAGSRIYGGLTTAMGGTNCALAISVVGGGDL